MCKDRHIHWQPVVMIPRVYAGEDSYGQRSPMEFSCVISFKGDQEAHCMLGTGNGDADKSLFRMLCSDLFYKYKISKVTFEREDGVMREIDLSKYFK